MSIEELKKQKASLKEAMATAFTKMLESASDEDIAKYKNMNKMAEEIDAQIEMIENNGKVPTKKTVELTESQKWAMKFLEAVSTGGNFSGGMPREMSSEVIKKLQQIAGVHNYCRTFDTQSEMSITVESGLPTIDYVAEAGQFGDTTPGSAPVNIKAYKLGGIAKINKELLKDVAFDVEAWVIDTFSRAIAAKLEAEILFGTGPTADHIEGVTTKSGIKTKACASATAPTWAEVKACLSALGPYKKGAVIILSQEVADVIDDFKDGSGNYLFPQNEELERIKGHTVLISESMPTPAAGKVLMVAGNFDYYQIGYRQNVEATILNELYAATDQVGVKVSTRLDGRVLMANAFSVLTGKVS